MNKLRWYLVVTTNVGRADFVFFVGYNPSSSERVRTFPNSAQGWIRTFHLARVWAWATAANNWRSWRIMELFSGRGEERRRGTRSPMNGARGARVRSGYAGQRALSARSIPRQRQAWVMEKRGWPRLLTSWERVTHRAYALTQHKLNVKKYFLVKHGVHCFFFFLRWLCFEPWRVYLYVYRTSLS